MQRILRGTCRVASLVLALGAAGIVIAIPAEAQIVPVSVNGNGHANGNGDAPCADDSRVFRARFSAAPYGWMSGISGETGVRDLTANVDISFGKLLDHLRFAAMGSFEAEYGPWVGIMDAIYSSVRDDQTPSLGPFNPELSMTMKMLVTQAFVGYTFHPGRDVAVDILAGTKIWGVDQSLRIVGDLVSGERSNDNAWADALGGLRVRWAAAERWRVSAAGDGGGGGSKGTGGATATVGYDVSSRWTLFGAYRYLFLNRRTDESFFTGHLGGPAIGGAYRW